jgi:hypothetical protein
MTTDDLEKDEQKTIPEIEQIITEKPKKKKWGFLSNPNWTIIPFGIILPLLAIATELITHMCSGFIFDPFPTVWHIALYAMISVGNTVILLGRKWDSQRGFTLLKLINGFILGIAFWYFLQGIALLPLGILAVCFSIFSPLLIIIGLCGLSPTLAILASFANNKQNNLVDDNINKGKKHIWTGIIIAILVMASLELHSVLTMRSMQDVISAGTVNSEKALKWLRKSGNKEVMLRRCYQRASSGNGIISTLSNAGNNLTTDDVRNIYYRVEGETFDNAPAPVNLDRGGFLSFDLDPDGFGNRNESEKIISGLSMDSSTIDGSVDADAALAYMQWTISFKNTTSSNQEAKMLVALPPGAVVSRLTLWINGEEHEAAFAARRRVEKAYDEIVSQERDPVLVTTNGTDRVSVQCFPVPPNGSMKIRIGITAPLLLESISTGKLVMPNVIDQNFVTRDSLQRTIWIESKGKAASLLNIPIEKTSTGIYVLRGKVPENSFTRIAKIIEFDRNSAVISAWTPDSIDPKNSVIQESFYLSNLSINRWGQRLAIVIDGSLCMKDSVAAISKAIAKLPEGVEFTVILAGDNEKTIVPVQTATPAKCAQAAATINNIKCVGGTDNVPALVSAWNIAAAKPSGAILWIHGPQPVAISDTTNLLQYWDRRKERVKLYSMDAVSGDNVILKDFDDRTNVYNTLRIGTLDDDIARVLAEFNGEPHLKVKRTRLKSSEWTDRKNSKETSEHLSRLWAKDQAQEFYVKGDSKNIESAIAIARRYQLVTPVTGAVVLETNQQYKDNGLEPVAPGTVPTVPEPEEWMLIIIAAAVLGYFAWKRKKRCTVL